jgi:1-acyl-sn-glycerol-3-phosphate acyltransferase
MDAVMGKTSYTVPKITRLNRLWLRPAFRGLFHLLGPVQIYGKENIPAQRPYLVAINHLSIVEPPFAVAFWPTPLEPVGAIEIWSKPGQGQLAKLYGGIPVHRGEYDRELIDQMVSALQAGHPLLIAPEGGRSHAPGLRRGKPGVAYIVNKMNILVIPVGIVGSTDDYVNKALHAKRPKLEMHIGKPLLLAAITGKGTEKRISLQRNTDQIMLAIAEMLPFEYRGVYANPDIDALGKE